MARPDSPPEIPSWTFFRGIWILNRTPPIFPHALVTCLCEGGEGGCNEVVLGLISRIIVFAPERGIDSAIWSKMMEVQPSLQKTNVKKKFESQPGQEFSELSWVGFRSSSDGLMANK